MNAKISVFVICVEAIIYLFLHNFHDCTFNLVFKKKKTHREKLWDFSEKLAIASHTPTTNEKTQQCECRHFLPGTENLWFPV